jgi:hypothetical protein
VEKWKWKTYQTWMWFIILVRIYSVQIWTLWMRTWILFNYTANWGFKFFRKNIFREKVTGIFLKTNSVSENGIIYLNILLRS